MMKLSLLTMLCFCCCFACSDGETPLTKFWVQSYPRSGTSLLSTLLRSHSQVRYLHERMRRELQTVNKRTIDERQLAMTIDLMLDKAYVDAGRERGHSIHAIGFKMTPKCDLFGDALAEQFNSDSAGNVLKRVIDANRGLARLRIVHLMRDDEVARLLSWREALDTMHYQYRGRDDVNSARSAHEPIVVDVGAFARELVADCVQRDRVARWIGELERAGHAVFRLSYERDLIDARNRDAAMDRLFAFLGVGAAREHALDDGRPPLLQSPQSSMSLSERVTNWRELLGALKDTHRQLCGVVAPHGKQPECCNAWMASSSFASIHATI
jgi:LPS sulfotransferase NodH